MAYGLYRAREAQTVGGRQRQAKDEGPERLRPAGLRANVHVSNMFTARAVPRWQDRHLARDRRYCWASAGLSPISVGRSSRD
jgi:hypothetical protein